MKRYVSLICALLFGCTLWPQSVTYNCRYWFDNNHAQAITVNFNNSTMQAEVDVGVLSNGLHTMCMQVADTSLVWNPSKSYMFFKTGECTSENLTYSCWFDQDISSMQSNVLCNGSFLLDVADLEEGIHTVNIVLQCEDLSITNSYMFLKVATMEMDSVDLSHLTYHCWFDQDIEHWQTDSLGNGHILLDVENLSDGFHIVSIMLEGTIMNVSQSYMFYKRPVGGNIAKWEYWLNDAMNNRQTTNLLPYVDTLSIITLLPVETWPIRSSCFHFHPNGDEPYINAKNKITFRFWDAGGYFVDKSSFYVDEQVEQSIEASVFERNSTETITAPRDNQIHWFKMDVGRGDYLSFQANKACTMQLFAPSGEEVYVASCPESILMKGTNVWEDGTYYLAVHDVTGSGEMVSVTYNWLNRYTILSYDVHFVGNGGCSTITYQGNGFNSLLDAYFVNYQNDTIRQVDIGHESNTTTTISFNFYGENLGVYDAVLEFYEETIRINGALEVQEPVDIVLASTVDNKWLYFKPNPITFTYTITNNGNMSAYAVPIYVYISTPTKNGISHLEFDGMNLASIISEVDLDSLSSYEILRLQEWADEIGEDHHFFKFHAIDEETGDSVFVRSNIFYLNLAPFETKTLTLRLVSDEPVNVWITIPNENILPMTMLSDRGFIDWYCCWKDRIACIINIIDGGLDIVSLFGGPALNLASCISSTLSVVNTGLSAYFCDDNHNTNFWDVLHGLINVKSLASMAVSCAKKFIPGANMDMLEVFDKLLCFMTLETLPVPITDCAIAFKTKNPECYSGNPLGGQGLSVSSFDPNDIYGYLSESGSHYMRQEIQNVQYEIEFENDTTLATAAAHTIIVRDTLDASKFDLNSLAARSVTIGDKRLDLNGEQTFARTLDLRPEIYVIAQINQDYDPTTGIIQWTIQSLDPMTMEPTEDPNQGVLPVNYYGDGVGFIDYSVNLRESFADGTEISNRAGIIFDQNDVIMTPVWTNIIDAVKPTSHIEEVTLMGDSLSFNFVSSDNRSGVWYHSLYYRNASTEQEWQVKKAQILENSFMLPFDSLQTTEYFVIAVDSAGNVEAMKTEAEVVVESSVSGYPFFVAGYGESTKAGWKFIASPVEGSIEPTIVDNIFGATQYDLYYFDQGEEAEWRNYKSNSFNLTNGQGYLYATKEDETLVFRGTYNDAEIYEVPLAYIENNPHASMRGWNLIGNPFTTPAYADRSYYTMNEEGTAIEPIAVSEWAPIPACNGVMVKAEAQGETVTFTRSVPQNAANQGIIQIAVVETTTRGNTTHDKAIVSFNPVDKLDKFIFRESTAKVYIPHGDKDYAIFAYTDKTGEIPVNFKAARNGEYSINVNTNGMEFNYLHLIDNLTGADVDLLALRQAQGPASYTFEAKTTDYVSRFKLVFSVCGDADGDNASFAFINNGNIIIIGAEAGAVLQIVDVLGRVLICRDAACHVSTNGMAPGVYILRLINGEDVKTQKIVVE